MNKEDKLNEILANCMIARKAVLELIELEEWFRQNEPRDAKTLYLREQLGWTLRRWWQEELEQGDDMYMSAMALSLINALIERLDHQIAKNAA